MRTFLEKLLNFSMKNTIMILKVRYKYVVIYIFILKYMIVQIYMHVYKYITLYLNIKF